MISNTVLSSSISSGSTATGRRPVYSAHFADLIEAGLVRLLDLVIISKSENGDLDVVEIEDEAENFGLGELELVALGLAGREDIEELAGLIPPGASAVLLALELLYARAAGEQGRRVGRRRSAAPSASPHPSSTRSSTPPKRTKEKNMPLRRMGRPGLVGLAARTAVVAGTATAVSGGRQRRRQGKARDQYERSRTRPLSSRRRSTRRCRRQRRRRRGSGTLRRPPSAARGRRGGSTSSPKSRSSGR